MERTMKIARIVTAAAFLGCVAMVLPLLAQSGITATDAVQSEQIQQLDKRLNTLELSQVETNKNVNWMLGGIAGIYALIGIVGIVNIRMIVGKK